MVSVCASCGKEEDLHYPSAQDNSKPNRELIDGAPYFKGLVCHACHELAIAKARVG